MSVADETADDERIADLRGFVMRELQRAKDAGALPSDLIVVLLQAVGEVTAATGEADVSHWLPHFASSIRNWHVEGLRRRLTLAPAQRGRLS